MYALKRKVLLQKDYRIEPNETVAEFVARYDGADLNPADPISVVAVDGKPFELNMTAAIILDELLARKDVFETAKTLTKVFGIDESRAVLAVNNIISDFTAKNIIERI